MNNTRNQTIDEVRADAARFWNDAVRAENEMMALRDRVARLVEALEGIVALDVAHVGLMRGMLINPSDERDYYSPLANIARAALAAAGEPKPASTPCDDCMAERDSLRAEIARLHRLHEPLTEEEKCLVAKDAHGHLVVRDLVALDLTNPNFSVRLFVAMLERSITTVKNRRA